MEALDASAPCDLIDMINGNRPGCVRPRPGALAVSDPNRAAGRADGAKPDTTRPSRLRVRIGAPEEP